MTTRHYDEDLKNDPEGMLELVNRYFHCDDGYFRIKPKVTDLYHL